MTFASDLTGQRFGKLVAVERNESSRTGHAIWKFRCDCGKVTSVLATNVKRGITKSCGCISIAISTKHGGYRTRSYKAWLGMKARAAGNGDWNKTYYSNRGIKICARWNKSFEAFFEDMGECPPSLTLERIENDGDYVRDNCRWATRSEQMSNTRRSHRVLVSGKTMCLAHACKQLGIRYRTAMRRISRGMTAQQAIEV